MYQILVGERASVSGLVVRYVLSAIDSGHWSLVKGSSVLSWIFPFELATDPDSVFIGSEGKGSNGAYQRLSFFRWRNGGLRAASSLFMGLGCRGYVQGN